MKWLLAVVFILGFVAGWVVLWLLLNHKETDLELAHDTVSDRALHKEENKNKILVFLDEVEEVTNDDVEHLLGVSNTTAWRYLEEMESEGHLVQKGERGRGVYYVRT